jgi:RNA polymerase sigma factor (sigma-70 family)
MRVATHLHTVRDPERLAGWLATIARRESLRVVRQRQRVTPVSDTDVLDRCDSARDPIAELAQQQRSFALRSLIQTLPDHQRKLLDLLMRDPAPSYREVSDTLSIPIGSIGPTRARCIAVLRDKCVSAGIEPIPA